MAADGCEQVHIAPLRRQPRRVRPVRHDAKSQTPCLIRRAAGFGGDLFAAGFSLSALSGSVRDLRPRRRLRGLFGLLTFALPFLEQANNLARTFG
jgi:hypothetical protein